MNRVRALCSLLAELSWGLVFLVGLMLAAMVIFFGLVLISRAMGSPGHSTRFATDPTLGRMAFELGRLVAAGAGLVALNLVCNRIAAMSECGACARVMRRLRR